jgi:hypothetical protein
MTDRDLALPTGYTDLLGELKTRVRAARTTALRTVNTQLIELYWSIGKTILERQEVESWGSGVIGRLADDLRAEFPDMKGFHSQTSSTCVPSRVHGPAWIQKSHRLWDFCRGARSEILDKEPGPETVKPTQLPPSNTAGLEMCC